MCLIWARGFYCKKELFNVRKRSQMNKRVHQCKKHPMKERDPQKSNTMYEKGL